ncbi:permease-like cell division protein FtsX [Candidatus Oleimmundimicrobium sp.]|uniref:permease-like cell division protein FtsX n=1 Tax=Candidatus Oleimmundimicrobium sp. TaxID=3060597 RepID=UPI002716A311|nr:permease-like cell division protein FtsX [Candidatus Oleimmundimicrobium sp.]MDO8885699.1 permease-like cell division protein FtsX [Candidatus Oleimmundimicrobium sp.]
MKFRPVYFIREATNNIRRNFAMSSAAISTSALAIFLVGIFFLVFFIWNSFAGTALSKLEIEVFLKDSVTSEQVENFQSKVLSWNEVKTIKYVSKDEALKIFKEKLKDKPEILEAMTGNPLPASIRIFLKDAHDTNAVVEKINNYPNLKDLVEDPAVDIKYGADYIEKLFSVIKIIGWVGLSAAILLCFASIVMIINTIRLTIFARRKEVSIMKLVGASSWFVRWPFLLEGMLQGFIGALVSIGLIYFVRVWVLRQVTEAVPFLNLTVDNVLFSWLIIGMILGGILIGATGSAIALRRFLKV